MDRRTTISTAAGITLTAAALVAAVGVSLGIMSDKSSAEGPGTFQPTAAVISTTDAAVPALDPSATSTTSTPTTAKSTGENEYPTPSTETDRGPDQDPASPPNPIVGQGSGVDDHRHVPGDLHESHEQPERRDADD